MIEKEKALSALGLLLETLKAAITFLADPTQLNDDLSSNIPALPLLHKDFLSLLALIYGSTTRLSLVLKPSSPSYTAALEPLKELSERSASLPHCVRLLQNDHGKTLAAEACGIAKDVLQALQVLVQTLITTCTQNPAPGKDGEYLVRTGAIHDIIEYARGMRGLSGNNLAAVIKIWNRNQESLNDGLEEVREIIENAEKPRELGADEDEFDDGWAELGISSNIKPSGTDLKTIKKIHAIVRLFTLLHQRLSTHLLSMLLPSLPLSKEISSGLDELAEASSELLSVSDNLISAMYPPQVAEHINIELESFQRQLTHLHSKIEALVPETSAEERLQNLQLSNPTVGASDHYTKLRKWYIVCINQINKNIHELELELRGSEALLA